MAQDIKKKIFLLILVLKSKSRQEIGKFVRNFSMGLEIFLNA